MTHTSQDTFWTSICSQKTFKNMEQTVIFQYDHYDVYVDANECN